jgi:hypothetical protein
MPTITRVRLTVRPELSVRYARGNNKAYAEVADRVTATKERPEFPR